MKNINKYLVYFSLIFLLYFLYSQEYLEIPDILSYEYFLFSLILSISSIIIQIINWHIILRSHDVLTSFKDSFISLGLYLMTKYIPGKIWGVIGKAGYISQKLDIEVMKLSYISFLHQVISILSALIFSAIGIIKLNLKVEYFYGTLVLLLIIIYFLLFQEKIIALQKKLPFFNRFSLKIQKVKKNYLFVIIPLWFFYWLIIAGSFHFLSLSILGETTNQEALFFSYPISTVIGMVLFVSPGGVGIREGALVFILASFGFDLINILSIAFVSRIIAVACELIIFILSISLKKF